MFDRIKQLFNRGYRDIKAVYYKDELLNMKLSTSVRKNYNIAKSIFAGMFGNITYECEELMICYKHAYTHLDEHEYTKMRRAFRDLGFEFFVKVTDDNMTVSIIPEQNLQRYYIDRAVGTKLSTLDSLRYLVH